MGYDKNITSFLSSPFSLDPVDLKTVEEEKHMITSDSSQISCDASDNVNSEKKNLNRGLKPRRKRRKTVHKKLLIKNILIEEDMSKLTERQRMLNQRFKSKLHSLDTISLLNFGFDLFPYDRNNIYNLLEIKNNITVGVEDTKENQLVKDNEKGLLKSKISRSSRTMSVLKNVKNVNKSSVNNELKSLEKEIDEGLKTVKKKKFMKKTKENDVSTDKILKDCKDKLNEVQNICLKKTGGREKLKRKTMKNSMREAYTKLYNNNIKSMRKTASCNPNVYKIRIKRCDYKDYYVLRLPYKEIHVCHELKKNLSVATLDSLSVDSKVLPYETQMVKYVEPFDIRELCFFTDPLNIFHRRIPFARRLIKLKKIIKKNYANNEFLVKKEKNNKYMRKLVPVNYKKQSVYNNDNLSLANQVTRYDFYKDSPNFLLPGYVNNKTFDFVQRDDKNENEMKKDEFVSKVSIYLDLLYSFFTKHKCELRKKIRLQIENLNCHIESKKSISDIEDNINLLLCSLVSCKNNCK